MNLFDKLFGKGNPVATVKVAHPGRKRSLVLQQLSQEELAFIGKNGNVARKFLEAYRINLRPVPFHPDNIGAFLYRWFEKEPKSNAVVSADKMLDCMAAAWGHYLATHLNMRWRLITDDGGTEIGLYHPKNELTIFPFQSVAKAIGNKDYQLLSEITRQSQAIINHR